MTRTSVTLPGLNLKNPIMPASGTFGFGQTPQAKKMDLNKLGALVLKTTTPDARTGNPQPQISILKDGVLNSVGLTNPGVEVVVEDYLESLGQQYPDLPIIASVGGASVDDYVFVTKKLSQSAYVNALEINVSCPNVAHGGMHFGTDKAVIEDLVRNIKANTKLPIYVKLTPNVTNIVEIAEAAQAGGADGLSMINTVLGMDFNIENKKATLGNGMGGLSGKAIEPIALRMIYQVHQHVDLPIIGMGGIDCAEDIVKFFLAGASAVAVGSAHFKDAEACIHLSEDLDELLEKMNVANISELTGQGEI